MMPLKGTLERVLLDALMAHPDGVSFIDLVGTGITEDNIDQIAENLRNGIFVSEDDDLILRDD